MNKEIKQKIAKIDKEIAKLQKEREKLFKQTIAKSSSFIDKFKIWIESGTGKHERYLPSESEYPHLRRWLDKNRDLQRHKTYNLIDVFDEYIYALENNDTEFISKEKLKEFENVAKEIMKKNITSFTCDW